MKHLTAKELAEKIGDRLKQARHLDCHIRGIRPSTTMVMEVITVTYQKDFVGAVSFDTDKGLGSFEYDTSFIKKWSRR